MRELLFSHLASKVSLTGGLLARTRSLDVRSSLLFRHAVRFSLACSRGEGEIEKGGKGRKSDGWDRDGQRNQKLILIALLKKRLSSFAELAS